MMYLTLERCIVFLPKLIVTLLLLKSAIRFADGDYGNHKTTGISHIPWNMLLDPNYTSHKPSANRTSFSPSHREEYSPPTSFSHQQSNFHFAKESVSPGIYYMPPKTQYPSVNHGMKFSSSFTEQDAKIGVPLSTPSVSHYPSEKILFPAASNYQVRKPELPYYVPPPQQKNKKTFLTVKENEVKRNKKRKPHDYFDMDDMEEDYLDSYYNDYDYSENEKVPYKQSKKASHYNKNKETSDPLGLLPSSTDPDGFFAKAKDLLKGGSYNKMSYSPSEPNYYSNYSPSKYVTDTEPYGGHSYYDHENTGYSLKDAHYGTPEYDYVPAHNDGNYGSVISYPDKRKGSKYGPLAFALGLLPLGLLLASLVPTVVTIPVTTAVATGRRRKRSVQFVNPVLETISEYGVNALEDPSCMNRIFCQVVRGGKQERSSIVQKVYFKIANILDEKIATYIGLKQLLLAVRKDKCHIFQCSTKMKPAESKEN